MKHYLQNRVVAVAALLCFLLALPVAVKAQEAYAVEDATTLTFYYDDQRANRTGTVYGIDQKWEDDNSFPAWAGCPDVTNDRTTKAVFDASFKTYLPTSTSFWFYKCSRLETIEGIENLKTENVTDMSNMFYNCSALTSLDLSSFDTAKVTNMSNMFYGCYSLLSLDLSNFNPENVTSMSNMFCDCSSLSSLNLSNFNTSNVTTMGYMFYGCHSLSSLDLSGFNTANVFSMSYMFYGCSSLSSLGLSNFNTENVTDMSGMFYDCSSLSSLDLSNFNTENTTYIYNMFRGCNALTSLDVSGFNTEMATSMYGMFWDCNALTSLDLSNFNTENVTDMSYMFNGCSALATIYCNDTWTCNESTDMFASCTSLKGAVTYDANYVDVSMANPFTGYFTVIIYEAYAVKDGTTLTFYYDLLSETRSGIVYTALDEHQWAGKDITKVVFDNSFRRYSPTSTKSWFKDCSSLETTEGLDNLKTENVNDMSNMFSGCSALTELELTNFNTTNVTDMNGMFYGCCALTTIYCNDTWTCGESTDMFTGCTSLIGAVAYNSSNVDVSMANPETGYFTTCSVENEAYAVKDGTTLTFYYDKIRDNRTGTVYTALDEHQWAGKDITKVVFDTSFRRYSPTSTKSWFNDCSSLETIEALDNLNTKNVIEMEYMFNGCSALTSLDVSSFNTKNVTEMEYMFSGCSALTSLDVSGFNTEKVSSMESMFSGCSALTSLDVTNFSTERVILMDEMFRKCSALTTIKCDNTWTCIISSTYMFQGCTSLKGAVAYDASKVDVSMANPYTGYFTATKGSEAYAVKDGTTLTFYYDWLRNMRSGTVYTVLDEHQWAVEDITKVVFHTLFKNYLPTSTASWFQDCKSLETIEELDNLNTTNVTDMSEMFYNCSALTELDMSNFKTDNVIDMTEMFLNCLSLRTIYCNDTWTCDVSTNMFKGCTSIKGAAAYDASKVDVTMANPETGYFSTKGEAYVVENGTTLTFYCDRQRANRTGTVYDINQTHSGTTNPVWAGSGWGVYNDKITKVVFDASFKDYRPRTTASWFYNCIKIATIEGFENLNTENVTNMGSMFWGCESLTELDLTGFNTAKVTNMLGTFYGCTALTELDVTDFVTDNVTIMDGMFNRCSKLTTIDVSGFNTENVTDMQNMFLYCSALEWLDLSNFNTEKVTDMHEMFSNCAALKTIYCNDAWTCDNSARMFYGCTSLKGAVSYNSSKVNVSMANPETGYFTTCSIENEAYAVENGTTLTFYYDRLCATRTGTVYTAFDEHQWTGADITKVIFDNSFRRYSPTSTAYWLYNCRKLETIEGLDKLNTENVTDMSYMFYNCSALTSLDVSGFNTEKVTNMEWLFFSCEAVTSLDVSNFNTENVTNMSYMFSWCRVLPSLNLSGFNTKNVTDMSNMFNSCLKLTSVDVSNFNTENVTDMNNMFKACYALASLDLSSFNTKNVTDMRFMFYISGKLTTIYCNDTWTCSNSAYMFSGCTSLVGAVPYDASKTDVTMANPDTGYFTKGGASSVSQINADADTPVEVFNLQGVKIADSTEGLARGIYIVRQGMSAKKMAVQ